MKVEIALRYFYCVFLLHRPVLYFYLHRDMEYTVRPPNHRALHSDREPWILESCRSCIDSAALIIRFSHYSTGMGETTSISHQSWTDVQMLFASYLVLLQVKPITSLVPILRNIGNPDDLLDKVENMFEDLSVQSLKIDTSLAILRNERHNFNVALSPYSIGST